MTTLQAFALFVHI